MALNTSFSHHAWDTPPPGENIQLVVQDEKAGTSPAGSTRPRWWKVLAIVVLALASFHLLLWRRSRSSADGVRRVPAFMTPGEIVLKRKAMMDGNKRPAARILKKGQALPGVALVFLTIRGVAFRSLWQRWFEDAYLWLEGQGLETEHQNKTRHRSDVIRAYVHHPYWLDPSLRQESVPPAMRPGIIENPADCTWWLINRCTHRAIQAAVDDFQEAEWFYTVGADAVPVKSFAEMYASLLDDPRSRLDFAHLVFADALPKTSNWVMLARPYAETLANKPDRWANEQFRLLEGNRLAAGADEWALYRPLLEDFGEDFFARQHPGLVALEEEAYPMPVVMNTFACWSQCQDWGENHGHYPPAFSTTKHSRMATIRNRATVMHARKYSVNTTVAGCPLRRKIVDVTPRPLQLEALREIQRINILPESRHTAGRDRKGQVANPESWSAARFGPYFSKQNCSMTEFLTWKLNLHSTAEEEEPKPPFTVLPAGYQSFKTLQDQHAALIKAHIFGIRPDLLPHDDRRSLSHSLM